MSGCVIWLTGIPAAGKTTIAQILQDRLQRAGLKVEVLDGDEIRQGLSRGLGFSREDREEHNRRVIFVARLLARNDVIVIVPLISPYREVRAEARKAVPNFVEVWINCPLDEAIRRDPKGLYRRALAGEIHGLTGLQDPYEPPLSPELIVNSAEESPAQCAARILKTAVGLGYLPASILA